MRTVARQPRPQSDTPANTPDRPGGKTPEGWEPQEWRQRYRDQRRRWRQQRERAERARQQKRLGLDDGLGSLAAAILAHPDIPDDIKRELAARTPRCHSERSEESSTARPGCHPESASPDEASRRSPHATPNQEKAT